MAQRDDIHELARGRWRGILMAAGISEKFLTGHHTACPTCGGKDRFRWDNKDGGGGSFCNVCGSRSGVDLIMAVMKLQFLDAKKWIMEQIGRSPVETVKPKRNNAEGIKRNERLWSEAHRLDGSDLASRYLLGRGIAPREYPSQIRFHTRVATDKREDGSWIFHPAMLLKFVSPDAKSWTLHKTFLDEHGDKARIPEPRMFAKVAIPEGGAVRLSNSAEVMGVGTGLETTMNAGAIFGVPVWATLNDGLLIKWKPPPIVKRLLIFGDSDEKYGGQAAAYALAHKLAAKTEIQIEVHIPPDLGTDWDDVRRADMEFAA